MITAEEARRQMLTVEQLADKQIPYIENRIKRAISENKKTTTIGLYDDEALVNKIVYRLVLLEYLVHKEYSFEHHGSYIHITW